MSIRTERKDLNKFGEVKIANTEWRLFTKVTFNFDGTIQNTFFC